MTLISVFPPSCKLIWWWLTIHCALSVTTSLALRCTPSTIGYVGALICCSTFMSFSHQSVHSPPDRLALIILNPQCVAAIRLSAKTIEA